MAFPFSIYNIAHSATGFKSQTHVYCNVIEKPPAVPSFSYQVILLFRIPQKRSQAPYFVFNGIDDTLSGKAVQAQYGVDKILLKYFCF